MFELKKETVEFVDKAGNKDVYEIAPVTGDYLEDLYFIMNKFQTAGEDEIALMAALGTEAAGKLHRIIFATLKQSYPEQDAIKLNQFVSQNLMKFIEPVMKVNLPKG